MRQHLNVHTAFFLSGSELAGDQCASGNGSHGSLTQSWVANSMLEGTFPLYFMKYLIRDLATCLFRRSRSCLGLKPYINTMGNWELRCGKGPFRPLNNSRFAFLPSRMLFRKNKKKVLLRGDEGGMYLRYSVM